MSKIRKQKIFDKAYNGLKSQDFAQSYGPDGKCRYRGPNGLKCAIGHLIKDDEYQPEFENKDAMGVALNLKGSILFEEYRVDGGFLNELQHVHDYAESAEDMKQDLEKFARANCLTVPEVG